jgi:hypothetical protein
MPTIIQRRPGDSMAEGFPEAGSAVGGGIIPFDSQGILHPRQQTCRACGPNFTVGALWLSAIVLSPKILQARAEDLFGEACTLRGYAVEKIKRRQDSKTPDFRIRFEGEDLIAEVKSPGLDPQIKKHMEAHRPPYGSSRANESVI